MHSFEPLTAAVLIDKDMGIGIGKDLLLHCTQYQNLQMRLMQTHPIIMGRHAYEQFPWDKMPNRIMPRILLLSSTARPDNQAEVFRTVKELIMGCPRRAVVFGGEQTYRVLLPYCDTIMACHADIRMPADKRFPVNLGTDKRWVVHEKAGPAPGRSKLDLASQMVVYRRDRRLEPVRRPAGIKKGDA